MRFGFILCLILTPAVLRAESLPGAAPTPSDAPIYVSSLPNIHDYSLFANGGWDGNWYVGFNTCWIKKLPPIPSGNYVHAYIGARLGRMKTRRMGRKSWEREAIPADFYIGIAPQAAWTRAQSYFLVGSENLPLEGNSENALEGVGESRWYWVEVPLHQVNMTGDNYLAIWSSTPELTGISSSPVLAAGWGVKDAETWLNSDIRGVPPRDAASALKTRISYFEPALAMKLVPEGLPRPLSVQPIKWDNGTPVHPKPVVTFNVKGDGIERVWAEYFQELPNQPNPRGDPNLRSGWRKASHFVWDPPYTVTVHSDKLPSGKAQLRGAALNLWGEIAYSEPFQVEVQKPK